MSEATSIDMDAFWRERERNYQMLKAAFDGVGLAPAERDLRWLSRWRYMISDDLLFQDRRSRQLTEAVAKAAIALRNALASARDYSSVDDIDAFVNDKLNVCDNIFDIPDEADEMIYSTLAIELRALNALNVGKLKEGKGRPKLTAYYQFLRDLHSIYSPLAGKAGYYETSTSAKGPFVDLAVAVQPILPQHMRLAVPDTIGTRIIEAMTEEIPTNV